MSLNSLFERAHDVARTVPHVSPQKRMAERAEELSRAGTMQAHLDVCIAAMVALANVLYATDADNRHANVDEATGRILIPLPWGSTGYRHWGLRKWEGYCLRKVLIAKCGRGGAVLFGFDHATNQWYIDMETFPTVNSALLWIHQHGPTLHEWRPIVTAHRTSERERKRAARS